MKKALGFTLIELSVVISILSILTTLGIASFVNYSRSQALQTAVSDLTTSLNLAKSRALSQVKPEQCSAQSLDGYKIVVSSNSGSYDLDAVCAGNTYKIQTTVFDKNISVSSEGTTSTSFFFPVISGPVTGFGSIVLTGFGKSKTITVDQVGVVR